MSIWTRCRRIKRQLGTEVKNAGWRFSKEPVRKQKHPGVQEAWTFMPLKMVTFEMEEQTHSRNRSTLFRTSKLAMQPEDDSSDEI